MAAHVTLAGGPLAGQHDGPMAWSMNRYRPPHFCTTDNGVWHLYVDSDPEADPPRYAYVGPCAAQDRAFGDVHVHVASECFGPADGPTDDDGGN